MNLHSIAAHIMLLRRMFAFSGNKDPFGGKENRLIQLAWKVEPLSDQTDPGLIQDLLQELEIPISDGDGPTLVDVPNLHTVLDFWGTADMRLTSVHYLCRTEGGRVRLVRDTSHNTKYWKQDLIKVTRNLSLRRVFSVENTSMFSSRVISVPPTASDSSDSGPNRGCRVDRQTHQKMESICIYTGPP